MNPQFAGSTLRIGCHFPEDIMCYEFDELYWQDRAEQARKAMEKARESKQPVGTAPAKPTSPDKETEVKVLVPA
jgi:hypothetical protein